MPALWKNIHDFEVLDIERRPAAEIVEQQRADVSEARESWNGELSTLNLWAYKSEEDRRLLYVEAAHQMRAFLGSKSALANQFQRSETYRYYIEMARKRCDTVLGTVTDIDEARDHLLWAQALISFVIERIAKSGEAPSQLLGDVQSHG